MTRHWPSQHRPQRSAQRPYSPVRLLAWGRHPGSEALVGACILAPVPQDRFLDDVEALCGDEARDRLLPVSVGLEGNHDGRLLAELASDFQELVGRRGSEDRIVKAGRTTDEDRIAEDQFQAVVVGQVVVGGELGCPPSQATTSQSHQDPAGSRIAVCAPSASTGGLLIPFEQIDRLHSGCERGA